VRFAQQKNKIPSTTSARLILCETDYFCAWSIVTAIQSVVCGIPLESSGLRFSSVRSMNIRLVLKIYRWPRTLSTLVWRIPRLLFHGPHSVMKPEYFLYNIFPIFE